MATLTVDAVAQMDAARAEVTQMGDAVRGMGADVDAAGANARSASVNFDGLADGSDNVASKSSQAAGAMGDLAGGLEAVGLTGAATALQGVALGSQVAAGAGDALNLVSETAAGKFIVQTAATVAHRTATIAGAAATAVMTGAQRALNLAMTASPIGLIVAGVLLLIGGLVLAYKHSETFRSIVDGAFTRAKEVIEGASEAVEDVIGWFKDLPGEARESWEAVRSAIAEKIGAAQEKVGNLIEDVKSKPREAVAEVAGYFASFFAPIQTAIGWVEDLIRKIASIDFPDLPFGWGGDSRSMTSDGGKPTAGTGDAGEKAGSVFISIPLTVSKADKDQEVGEMVAALREYYGRRGKTLSLTEGPA